MTAHFPALQVVIPLLTAPICLLARRAWLARTLATAVTWACFAIACAQLGRALDGTVVSYAMGGWAPPWGIEYRVDALNALVLVVITAVASVALPIGVSGATHAVLEHRQYLFCSMFMLCMAGLSGMAITGDAFNVFVFLEISSLSSYVLISIGAERKALTAAFSYLIMGTLGGTFILIGIGLMYQTTGTLNIADLSKLVPRTTHIRTIQVAFGFLTIGTAIKLAVFPLHQWLPNAYAYAPSAVSAFLAGTATKVIYYFLLRVIFTLFGAAFVFDVLGIEWLLMPMSLLAMFAGSLAAIYQNSVKRLLAYSSIAQIGYLTLALSFGTPPGVLAGVVHLFNHALMKGGLFLCVACFMCRIGSDRLEDLGGVGRRMPLTSAAFVIGGLGLIGVPATSGFVSKWFLISAALDANRPVLAVLILASSLLAVIYVWRFVEVAYFKEPTKRAAKTPEAPAALLVPTWAMASATVVFGLYTYVPVRAAEIAAEQLFATSPRATAEAVPSDRPSPHAMAKLHPERASADMATGPRVARSRGARRAKTAAEVGRD